MGSIRATVVLASTVITVLTRILRKFLKRPSHNHYLFLSYLTLNYNVLNLKYAC